MEVVSENEGGLKTILANMRSIEGYLERAPKTATEMKDHQEDVKLRKFAQ